VLAPRLGEINQIIKSVRPDSISGIDGSYSEKEQGKFLRILTELLYPDVKKPENIVGYIALFNRTDPAHHPERRLRELGILNIDKQVSEERLKELLKQASQRVK
jgi:hypothetical protein